MASAYPPIVFLLVENDLYDGASVHGVFHTQREAECAFNAVRRYADGEGELCWDTDEDCVRGYAIREMLMDTPYFECVARRAEAIRYGA